MGQCSFKGDGSLNHADQHCKYTRSSYASFLTFVWVYSVDEQEQLQLPVCDRPWWLRKSLASGVPKDDASLCHERNVQGKNNRKALSYLGDEREKATGKALAPLPGEHQLRLPRPR
jgi:hypothetical protein